MTIIIDTESSESETSEIELSNIADAQKKGSEITYYRRYTLQSLLGLQADDDDGNMASRPNPATTPPYAPATKKWLNRTNKAGDETREWSNVMDKIGTGTITDINQIKKAYKLSIEIENLLLAKLS